MKTIIQFCALLCVSLLLSFLTACSTAVIDSHSRLTQAGETESAKVYFLRPDVSDLGWQGTAVSILFDGEELLTLARGDYALVYLQPGAGTLTVESMKNGAYGIKVKTSEEFLFEAGKTYHILICKRIGEPEESLSFPILIEGSYAKEGSGALRPVGDAIREPLSAPKSVSQAEASSIMEEVCEAAQNKEWYSRLILSDCVKVKKMLLKQQGGDADVELSATSFCGHVVQECLDNPRGEKCRSLIQSYDTKRQNAGTSLLMHIAGSRIPRGNRPLYDSGDTAYMLYLLDIGFDPNVRVSGLSTDPIMEYIAPGYLSGSIGSDAYDVTPLMIAVVAGDRRMVNLLLRAGANPNTQNDQGATALMYAANLDNLLGTARDSIVADLLEAGAKPDIVSRSALGATALMAAAHKGNTEVVRILLEHGADTLNMDLKGITAHAIPDYSDYPMLYIGATLNYFDVTQSGEKPVSHGNSTGYGFLIGLQTSVPKAWLFPRPVFYGIELEYNNTKTNKGWGGRLAGLYGTIRAQAGGMGDLLLRIGVVNTQIQLSSGQSIRKTNAAFGLGWGAIVSGSLGFEVTGTGILGPVVGSDELSSFGLRVLYAF